MDAAVIARIAGWVCEARRIAVLTGAGVSTASGIPDFRSANGIYATRETENVFDLTAFRRAPGPCYAFARWFYPLVAAAQPNAAHATLAAWERRGRRVEIATQNVDDLHQRAGSTRVDPVHGTGLTHTCLQCSKAWNTADLDLPSLGTQGVLRCDCGGMFKSDITFFGEALPEGRRADARLVIVNRDPTPLDGAADAVVRDDLPAAMAAVDRLAFQA